MTKQKDIEFTISELKRFMKSDKSLKEIKDSLINLVVFLETCYITVPANSQKEYDVLVKKLRLEVTNA